MPAPASLITVAEPVERCLRDLFERERKRWLAVDPELDAPLDSLERLILAGGKRLRPSFCYWAFVGAGGDPTDRRVVEMGAALETLHAFALVHDDVMDGSHVRRGGDTVHREHVVRHVGSGWRGEDRRFGEGVAILVGDLALVYADVLLTDAPAPARTVYDELRIELCMGQYLDLLGTARGGVGLEGACQIACYKSGKYTIERPLHMGAALAGRLEPLAGPLSAYGLPLGEAFQLRDDVLGAFGETAATGKPVGDDLRAGKPTPLLALAHERATAAQAAELERVGDPSLEGPAVARLQEVLVDTGAVEELERRITALTDDALAAAETLPLCDGAKAELAALAVYVSRRAA